MLGNTVRVLFVDLIENGFYEEDKIDKFLKPANGHIYITSKIYYVSDTIKALQTVKYDTVILNLVDEPHKFKVFSALKNESPTTPFICLTEEDDTEVTHQLVRCGAQDCIGITNISAGRLRSSIISGIERQTLINSIHTVAMTDELTTLYNRKGFNVLATQQLKTIRREKLEAQLYYIDMDNLKTINDKLGHKVGDRAIQTLADILKSTFRDSDIVARVGGDEFVVLTATSHSNRDAIVNRLHRTLQASDTGIQVSIGSVSFQANEFKDIDSALVKADFLMYQSKKLKKEKQHVVQILATDQTDSQILQVDSSISH